MAISRIEAVISSVPAATVCTLRDTSSAARVTESSCRVALSLVAPTCAEVADSSSEAAATVELTCPTWPSSSAIERRVFSAACAMRPTSSSESTSAGIRRSPRPIASRLTRTDSTERTIARLTVRATKASKAITSSSVTIVMPVTSFAVDAWLSFAAATRVSAEPSRSMAAADALAATWVASVAVSWSARAREARSSVVTRDMICLSSWVNAAHWVVISAMAFRPRSVRNSGKLAILLSSAAAACSYCLRASPVAALAPDSWMPSM